MIISVNIKISSYDDPHFGRACHRDCCFYRDENEHDEKCVLGLGEEKERVNPHDGHYYCDYYPGKDCPGNGQVKMFFHFRGHAKKEEA